MRLRTVSIFALAVGMAGLFAQAGVIAAEDAQVEIEDFTFRPQDITVTVGQAVRFTNKDDAPHTATAESGAFNTGALSKGQSAVITFTFPATLPYFCEIHPNMRGMVTVLPGTAPTATPAAATATPVAPATATPAASPSATPTPQGPSVQLHLPPAGSTLPGMGTELAWTNPAGTRFVQVQVIPANNDGPGIDLLLGPVSSFPVPAPPTWYGLLPDMTYAWRVRVTASLMEPALDSRAWGPWVATNFRTPKVAADVVSGASPAEGSVVGSRTPTLRWASSRNDLFYYEVQLSKDNTFNTDPQTASASVYSALIHGALATPANSYTVPADAPLEPNTRYYWRVRPRVQGDGTPMAFSPVYSFRTP